MREACRRFFCLADDVAEVLRPTGAKYTPLFLKEVGGLGEGENFFSREKKFSPSPKKSHSFSKRSDDFVQYSGTAGNADAVIGYGDVGLRET